MEKPLDSLRSRGFIGYVYDELACLSVETFQADFVDAEKLLHVSNPFLNVYDHGG